MSLTNTDNFYNEPPIAINSVIESYNHDDQQMTLQCPRFNLLRSLICPSAVIHRIGINVLHPVSDVLGSANLSLVGASFRMAIVVGLTRKD